MKVPEGHDAAERHEGEHRRSGNLAEKIGQEGRERAECLVAIEHHRHLREQELKTDEHDGHRDGDNAHALEGVRCQHERRSDRGQTPTTFGVNRFGVQQLSPNVVGV